MKSLTILLLAISVSFALTAQPTDSPKVITLAEMESNPDFKNLLNRKAGAQIVAFSSHDSTEKVHAENIINESLGTKGLWRTAYKRRFPHWVVVQLPETKTITTFVFCTAFLNEYKHTGVTAGRVVVELSDEGPDKGFKKVATEILKKNKDQQVVTIEATNARWVKIIIENNWDHPTFTELGRVYAYDDVTLNQYEMVLAEEKKLDLSTIHFASNSADILPASLPVIEMMAEILANNADWKVTVEGHTDTHGTTSANQSLSQERAEVVVNLLISAGIDKTRLTPIGFGESKLLSQADTEEAHALNRRVTFRIVEEK